MRETSSADRGALPLPLPLQFLVAWIAMWLGGASGPGDRIPAGGKRGAPGAARETAPPPHGRGAAAPGSAGQSAGTEGVATGGYHRDARHYFAVVPRTG